MAHRELGCKWPDEPCICAPIRVGEDGHLTLKSEPKPCLPVECPPERTERFA